MESPQAERVDPYQGHTHSSLASLMLDRTVDFSWEKLGYHVKVEGDDGELS